MLVRWLPSGIQAETKTDLRKRTMLECRPTRPTLEPSIATRADPRVGPRTAIQATCLPLKLNVALAPAARAARTVPPR